MTDQTKNRITRRGMIASLGAMGALAAAGPLAGPLGRAAWAADGQAVGIWGPPAGPSVVMAHLTESSAIQRIAPGSVFKAWRNPDQLRAGVTSGQMQVTVVPSYVGANLFNRGMPVRMLNVMTWGLLYLMTSSDQVNSLADIAGKTVIIPFKNDMPDLIFRHIAAKSGLVAGRDFTIQNTATMPEAVQFLITRRAEVAVLSEPLATAAVMQGMQNAVSVRRALNIQEEWARVTGRAPELPQAGAIVTDETLEKRPELVAAIRDGAVSSTAWVKANPASAGRLAQDYLGLGAPVIEQSIPFSNLRVASGIEAKDELEFLYQTLAEQSPDLIGGKLPDPGFYI